MQVLDRVLNIRDTLRERFQTKLLIFFIVSGVQAIDNINTTSFMTSVEQIQSHYGCTYALASWTLSAYTVTFSSFIAFFGRTGDILGQSEVFLGGLFFLTIFSIVGAAVDSLYVLIVFRALQGVAAAATIPPTYAIVVHTYNGKSLHIAIGFLTGSLVISLAVGLIIGGAFSESKIGYKGTLWVVAAYSLASFVLAGIFLDRKKGNEDGGENVGKMKNLDYPGVALFISGAILLVTGFTEAGASWKSPKAYVPIIVGFLLIVAFFAWEALFFKNEQGQSVDLLIPKRMWSVSNFKVIPIVTFFMFGAYFVVFLLTTEFFQYASGRSAILSAVMFAAPVCVIQLLVTIIFSLHLVKLSTKTICGAGLSTAAIGIGLLTKLSPGHYWRYGLTGIILFSGGSCSYFVNYLNLIITATPLEMQGLVSGICLTLGQFGSAIFTAGGASILGSSILLGASQEEMAGKIRNAIYLALAGYLAGVVLVFTFVRNLTPESQQIGHRSPDESSDVVLKEEEDDSTSCQCEIEKLVEGGEDSKPFEV